MVNPGPPTLGHRYELLSVLATGGMGQVWRSRDLLLNRPVAVKLLRSEFTGDATFVARFRAEARHAAVLAHPNIATLFDYGEALGGGTGHEHVAYLVMELVEGESLADLLSREGRLPAGRTMEILRQTAAALAVAHEAGVVHRDIKPGNVLVRRDGVVKITDFGIACSASSVPLTQTGQLIGTAHYLSPEQAAGIQAGPASDVYALGMVGYECLAGRRAFEGESSLQIALRQLRDAPEPLPPDVPDKVRALIDQALVKDPDRRFADGGEFCAAVDDVRAGRWPRPASTRGGTRIFPSPGWASSASAPAPGRRRARRALAPLVALLAGAGIAVAGLEVLGAAQPAPAAADGTDPAAVVLAAGDYVGRPVEQVAAELAALGFRVGRSAHETITSAPGLVTAISPAGAVPEGARITVAYAVAPAPVPEVVVPDVVVPDVVVPDVVVPDVVVPDVVVPDVVVPDVVIPDVVIPDVDISGLVVPGPGAAGHGDDDDDGG